VVVLGYVIGFYFQRRDIDKPDSTISLLSLYVVLGPL
jgi:hypothetical protein